MASKSPISRRRLTQLLANMKRKRIVVVGDAMLDVYLGGDVERISPEAPVPVVKVRERRYALGGAANVAQNVAAAGAIVSLVGAAGSDNSGVKLRAMLEAIGADRCCGSMRKTTVTCRRRTSSACSTRCCR
jgi:D-glycero-beta-D-manno-heptose-7-phosphate kinase